MSLPHALLSNLVEQPGSGIELSNRFDRSIGYYWHASHQQIYRELGRMEAAGWVQALPPEAGRGGKRIYQVLPAGRIELRRWAGEPQDPAPPRNEMLICLRAEAVVGKTGVAGEVERRLALHRARLELYRQIEATEFTDAPPSRNKRIQHLILTAGIMNESMWVQWSEQALAVLASD